MKPKDEGPNAFLTGAEPYPSVGPAGSYAQGQDFFLTGGDAPAGQEQAAAGTMFAGRYRIVDLLGVGGMGHVYRVEDTLRQEQVALKLLSPHLVAQLDARDRFLRELKVTERLHHPGIVRVLGLDQDMQTQTLCFAMELIEGESLESILSRAPKNQPAFGLEEILATLEKLAEILDYAHGQGVIHRDLKPSNIMVQADGSLKLLDFGIARAMLSEAQETKNTSAGWGTAYYMAPEQLHGDSISPKADIFALGVIAYQMMLGALPIGMPSRPSRYFPEVSEAFDDALFRAMEPDPQERYDSAGAFVQALRAHAEARRSTPPPPSSAISSAPQAPPMVARVPPPIAAQQPTQAKNVVGVVVALGLVLMLGGAAVGMWFFTSPALPSMPQPASRAGFGSQRIVPMQQAPQQTPYRSRRTRRSGSYTIPVSLQASTQAKGLKLEARHSELRVYRRSSFYTLRAVLVNEGQVEFEKIRALIQLLDRKGRIVRSYTARILDSHQASLYPKDRHGFQALIRANPRVRKASMRIEFVQKNPASGPFAGGKAIQPNWLFEKPSHIKLAIVQRRRQLSKGFRRRSYFKGTWAIKNEGQSALKQLKLQIKLFDRRGRALKSNSALFVYSSLPTLNPGETRLYRTIFSFRGRFHHYKLSIVEAE